MNLISNPMRFGTSTFNFHHRAFLVSREAWDTSEYTNVEGFDISGAAPANCERRIIFKIGDALYKFSGNNLVAYDYDGEYDDVIENGNTVSELITLTDIPAMVNKQIYPIIALFAPVSATAMPSIKIGLKVRSNTEKYTKTVTTGAYKVSGGKYGGTPRIISITKNETCTGNGTVNVKIALKNSDDTWTDFMDTADAIEYEATAFKYKYVFNVNEINGDDSAKLNKMVLKYTSGAAAVSGSNADLYSVVNNYETNLQTCYIVVKHQPLIDSQIKAYVNFMQLPKRRELITIGTSNGTFQTLTLGTSGADTGIDQASIQLYADGVPLLDYDYNMEVGTVTINVESGKTITASYDYGHDTENWLAMTKDIDSQPYLEDGTYMSRFSYTLPDNQTENKQISNIRLQMTHPSGTVTNQSLGKATGKTQMIVLPHSADKSSINLNADWSYDADSQILTFIAAKNTALTLSYSWDGEQVKILGYTVGWSAA